MRDTSSRLGSVLVQKSVEHITSLDVFYEEECESRCIGEVLERYRGEDAGDLKRRELELVENWTCLSDPREDFSRSVPKIVMGEKSWKAWKSNQNVVMDEELVQNVVMDEEWRRNGVMCAQIREELCDGCQN